MRLPRDFEKISQSSAIKKRPNGRANVPEQSKRKGTVKARCPACGLWAPHSADGDKPTCHSFVHRKMIIGSKPPKELGN
jgi:hypothetical protein